MRRTPVSWFAVFDEEVEDGKDGQADGGGIDELWVVRGLPVLQPGETSGLEKGRVHLVTARQDCREVDVVLTS